MLQLLQGGATVQLGAPVDGGRADALAGKAIGHEIGMGDGDAEGQGALLRLNPPVSQGMSGAAEGGELVRKGGWIEAPVAPGDLPVVHRLVIDPEIVERAQ
jgi:hypothetical protein